MSIIRKIDKFIARIESWFLVIVLGSLTLFSALDVILGLFSSGLEWINRFFGYSMLTLALIGASVATHQKRHITIDMFSRFLPKKTKLLLLIVINLAAAWVAFVFAREGWHYVLEFEKPSAKPLILGAEEWMLFMVIPFSFAMITIRFIFAAICDLWVLLGRMSEGDAGLVEPPPALADTILPSQAEESLNKNTSGN